MTNTSNKNCPVHLDIIFGERIYVEINVISNWVPWIRNTAIDISSIWGSLEGLINNQGHAFSSISLHLTCKYEKYEKYVNY